MASFPPYVESDYVVFFPILFGEDEPPYVFEASLGVSDDYTWDQFSEDGEYIDRTWDEWYGDSWGTGVSFTFGIVFKALGGYLKSATSSAAAVATQADTTCNRLRDQTAPFEFTAAASLSGNAFYQIASGVGSLLASVTQANTPNRLRDQPSPIIYNTAFASAQNANATFGPSPSFVAAFSQLSNLNYVLAQLQPTTLGAQFTAVSNLNYILAKMQPLTLAAFAFELTEARLISQVDPFFTIKALQEIRTLVVPEYNRIIECLMESRVNTASTETRRIAVLQETRKNLILTPALINRSSVPRVRGN